MLAANRLARALYAPVLADPRRPANNARFVYLDPAAREFFADWERAADDIAAMLRSEAGSNPHDKQLIELIGELSTRSDEFRTRWAAHNVRFHRTGHKRLHHPVAGPWGAARLCSGSGLSGAWGFARATPSARPRGVSRVERVRDIAPPPTSAGLSLSRPTSSHAACTARSRYCATSMAPADHGASRRRLPHNTSGRRAVHSRPGSTHPLGPSARRRDAPASRTSQRRRPLTTLIADKQRRSIPPP
jgi:hypothetical protein